MYTNFEDLYKAYGLDNGKNTRDDLNINTKKEFVNDCYDTYEYIGFAETFRTPYTEEKKYTGMKFKVLERVKDILEDENGASLESLPMWNIQLENGDIISAYPEEICLAEITSN